jgi:hypothetical protein|tara:strand:+ start:307 stop:546 length:240 start_codon:yes stop_codon:yes gene_type:complete
MSKLKKEELELLQKQENGKAELKLRIGDYQYQIFLLQQAIYSIDLEQKETKEELEKSYGKINVDLKTGEFEVLEDEKES